MNPGEVLDAMTELGIEGSSQIVGGATFETAALVAPMAKGAPAAAVVKEGQGAAATIAIEESQVAARTVAQTAERSAAQRASFESALRESQAARAAMKESGGFQRYVQAETRALTSESGAARQTTTSVSESLRPSKGAAGAVEELPEGSFSITERGWRGYPEGVARPTGPFRILTGTEYEAARKAANRANQAIRKADPASAAGKEIHEIKPVKFGGSPTEPVNKIKLPRGVHRVETTPWWNRLLRSLQNSGGGGW